VRDTSQMTASLVEPQPDATFQAEPLRPMRMAQAPNVVESPLFTAHFLVYYEFPSDANAKALRCKCEAPPCNAKLPAANAKLSALDAKVRCGAVINAATLSAA